MELASALIAAVCLDRLLGEPGRLHPLVGFGQIVARTEAYLYGSGELSSSRQKMRGGVGVAITVIPFALIALYLQIALGGVADWLLSVAILYLAIGFSSLRQHALSVQTALASDDLPAARGAVACLVSRHTDDLSATQISAATVESVLENGNDAVFGALFWFVVAGIPGVVVYRLVNTLDAIWGYKNERYLHFGRCAALLDDTLNWIPARLTALSYALLGHFSTALNCWKQQGAGWKSPNAGPVMAAGAGALGCRLGGAARYHGEVQQRPTLGAGKLPVAADIARSLALVWRAIVLWCALAIILAVTAAS